MMYPGRRPRRAVRALVASAALAASPSVAWADEGDGVYGRFDGDFEVRVHAGAAFASGGPGLDASLTALYLSSAGVYVHYTDAVGGGGPAVVRSIATGVHVSPLFLIRGAFNGERGPAFLDLLIDSFGFEIGAVWAAARPPPSPDNDRPSGRFEETPGLEAALGIAIPILGRATGPYIGLRAALRWRPEDFAAGAPSTIASRGGVLSLTLGWHHVLGVHVIDPGDRVTR